MDKWLHVEQVDRQHETLLDETSQLWGTERCPMSKIEIHLGFVWDLGLHLGSN